VSNQEDGMWNPPVMIELFPAPVLWLCQLSISGADSGKTIPSNNANLLPGLDSHIKTFEHEGKTRSVTEEHVLQFYTAMSWPPCGRLVVWQIMRCFLFNFCRIINDSFHRIHVIFSFCGLSDEPSESDMD
jgi:hypothetical protein